MPRQARIDAPGLLHHVISRGLERRDIFKTVEDHQDFLERIETCLHKSPNQILAWALMPNHFHLLMRSGSGGISCFMRCIDERLCHDVQHSSQESWLLVSKQVQINHL